MSESALTSKTNPQLFGHQEPEDLLLAEIATGKLPHGIILSGPRGIGKATFAYRFARTLLTPSPLQGENIPLTPSPFQGEGGGEGNFPQEYLHHGENPHPYLLPEREKGLEKEKELVFRRVAAGSHADLLVIEPIFDEKKGEAAREITAEQAREVSQFFSLTAGENGWRIAIIDSADALNTHAANAILKILEEPPPQAMLLLISHNPGRLLPTIRSRCRMLRLKPLGNADFASALRHINPAIDAEDMAALCQLSNHAPGLAAELAEQGALALYEQLLRLCTPLPDINALDLHNFSAELTQGKQHANWQLFSRLMLLLLERLAKRAAGIALTPILEAEEGVLSALAPLHSPALWATKWQQAADQFSLAERLHLDYKQIIIAFFHTIASTEGFQLGNTAA